MIKDLLLKIRSKWLARNHTQVRRSTFYKDAKLIGLLFSDDNVDQEHIINSFVQKLSKDGKKVKALAYYQRPHGSQFNFNVDTFTKKDITPFGELKSYKVDQFIDFEFDFLFCINTQPISAFDYILLKSKSKFRVGIHYPSKEEYFEMMIEKGDDVSLDVLLDQMYHYTQSLSLNE